MKLCPCDSFRHTVLVPGLILILCLVFIVVSAVAAPARGIPPTTTAPLFTARVVEMTTAPVQQTVTCQAPCSCMERSAAIAAWGADGFTQCAELPCAFGSTPTGLPIEKNCFKQKAVTVPAFQYVPPATTTPAPGYVQGVPVLATTTTIALAQFVPKEKVVAPVAGFKAPENLCGGEIVDLGTDQNNCGSCGTTCEAGKNEACIGGLCKCKPGTLICDPALGCKDVDTNPHQCGSCNHECAPGQTCYDGQCHDPYLKLLFIPLNWKGDQADFDTAVDQEVNVFVEGIPLKNCPYQVGATKMSVTIQDNNPFACGMDLRNYATGQGIDIDQYDVVIGFGQTPICPPAMGVSNCVDTLWGTQTSSRTITAHELGHIYGLSDEYCSNPAGSTDCRCNDGDIKSDTCGSAASNDGAASGDINWLDSNLGCDQSGNSCCNDNAAYLCAAINYGPCCLGNRNPAGGRCIMSFGNAPGPRSFCQHCKDQLAAIPKLQCHSPPLPLNRTIVDLSVIIHADDTVTDDALILTDGRPTYDYQIGTGYELRVLDARGIVVMSRKFDRFFDYMGPVERGVDYSSVKYTEVPFNYRIPYNTSMQNIQIYHGDNMIYAKELDFCNRNGSCDTTETFRTCPNDCPLDRKDKVCTPVKDSICDPDCLKGVDPDCSSVLPVPLVLGVGLIVACVGAAGWYFIRKRKGAG